MKLIPLNRGLFAKVDDADYEYLMQWKWQAHLKKTNRSYYAERTEYLGKIDGEYKSVTIAMHRVILGLKHGDKRLGDHKDLDTLNDQRNNLRISNHSQNRSNTKSRLNSTSKYLGVCFYSDPRNNSTRWKAQLTHNRKKVHLGYYDTPEEAAMAYNVGAMQYHGEFANLNIL